jgi:hypothetical protein
MNISDLIKRHQLIAYFVLTFVISWAVEFLIPRSNGFFALGGLGPLFSAVIITRLLPSDKTDGYPGRRFLFFGGTFLVMLLIWLGENIIPTAPRYDMLTGVAVAAIFALALSGIYSSRNNVRELLAPLAQWRVGWLPWAAVLILAPMLILVGVLLDLALGARFPG